MDEKIFNEALDAAVKSLSKAMAEREGAEKELDKLNTRIEQLKESVRGLSGLCGIDAEMEFPEFFLADMVADPGGFTDAIRVVLSKPPIDYLSAVDVRDRLKRAGFAVDKYSNVLASIHTVLRRLYKGGEVNRTTRDGRTCYIWSSDPNEE